MKWIIGIVIFASLVGGYAVWRPHLVKAYPNFYAKISPVETWLFSNSETILWARLKMLTGALLALLTAIGSLDYSPLLLVIPSEYQTYVSVGIQLLPFTISAVGMMDEFLRRKTTLPLDVVALPEDVKQEPAMQQALAAVREVHQEVREIAADINTAS